jgi:phosphatidylglycerophosphate synthase
LYDAPNFTALNNPMPYTFNRLPITLIYARLVIGFTVIVLSVLHVHYYQLLAVMLLTIGLLTDIFDGIIARRLNISTEKMRRLDSLIDQLFFLSIAVATNIQCPAFFKENVWKLSILIGFECLAYLICFLKFKKEIATHSIGAKIWTLLLFATLIQVMLQCSSNMLFNICFWVGMMTRLEIIAIILTLKQWANDVPTIYSALQLRRGKAIKRNKLFNG